LEAPSLSSLAFWSSTISRFKPSTWADATPKKRAKRRRHQTSGRERERSPPPLLKELTFLLVLALWFAAARTRTHTRTHRAREVQAFFRTFSVVLFDSLSGLA
jgi:hypothetical protein